MTEHRERSWWQERNGETAGGKFFRREGWEDSGNSGLTGQGRGGSTVGLRHVLRVWRVVRYLRTVRKGWSAEKSSADSERREERGKKSGGRGEGVKRLR